MVSGSRIRCAAYHGSVELQRIVRGVVAQVGVGVAGLKCLAQARTLELLLPLSFIMAGKEAVQRKSGTQAPGKQVRTVVCAHQLHAGLHII